MRLPANACIAISDNTVLYLQASQTLSKQEAKISRLANGAVVASCENLNPVSRLAVLYNAGSRYEDTHNKGITHAIRAASNLTNAKSTGKTKEQLRNNSFNFLFYFNKDTYNEYEVYGKKND